MENTNITTSPSRRFSVNKALLAWLWLAVRFYLGYQWLVAGFEKLQSPVWIGSKAGVAMKGFLLGSLQKTSGDHPDVLAWYAYFIEHVCLPHPIILSYLVVYGEIAVGIALIAGLFTGLAAFFGAFMNLNYLLAGSVGINLIMLLLQIALMLAYKTAGVLGLDHYLLPILTDFKKSNNLKI